MENSWSPEDSPIWRALLEHWKENDPARVRLLFKAGKLRQALNDETDNLLGAILKLKQGGLNDDEAREVILGSLCQDIPREEPTNPLTEDEIEELKRWSLQIAEE